MIYAKKFIAEIHTKKYEVSGKANFRIVSFFLRVAYACPLLATRNYYNH